MLELALHGVDMALGPEPGFDALALIRAEQRALGAFAYVDRHFRAALHLAAEIDAGSTALRPLGEELEAFHELLAGPAAATKTLLAP